MKVMVNSLIQWKENQSIARILWMDPMTNTCIGFPISEKKMSFKLYEKEWIDKEIETGKAVILSEDEWMVTVAIPDDSISEAAKSKRDKAWAIISEIHHVPDVFNQERRAALIRGACKKFSISQKTVYNILKKYWKYGMTKNALLPNYENCGGKNKERHSYTSKLKINSAIENAVIDVEVKRKFKLALEKYYHSGKRNSLATTYRLMIREYFTHDFKIKDGVKVPVLNEDVPVPTLRQFRYWVGKNNNDKISISKREGLKHYQSNARPLLGDSTYEVTGPGAVFQIDATVVDLYLVSRYERSWIIGRPVLYLVMDTFSRVIAGVYVGVEAPSWIGAMMALENATSDKVSYCRGHGIHIIEDEWPASHVPQTIMADRGEFEGKSPEGGLIEGLHISIQNSSSYRGDMKAIVERHFRTIHDRIKPFVPGYINVDFQKRGGKDYRLDATLDIHQFTKIIIKIALHHNNFHLLKNYQREVGMIEDGIESIPNDIWNWGIRNKSGCLRSFPPDIIKLNLMPTEVASVTERGIRFHGMLYGSEKAMREQWFQKAKIHGSWKLKVSYDVRSMSAIYVRAGDKREYEKCYLLEHQERYKSRTYEEVAHLHVMEKQMQKKAEIALLQNEFDIISEIEAVVQEAQVLKNTDRTISKKNIFDGIRENRDFEKSVMREAEAFEINVDKSGNEPKVMSSEKVRGSILSMDLLRQKQEEKR
ncbi:Mu transposase C-terminal domain-containing protein [Anoxynatronum buryatiense]|uniref:Mu transposase, C-terminal n=1 Tax=Anoxynatronum buryatiense TaxID=489973 RepID=A0AA45WZ43_9CLOT|nr:Mu transposase C-terminal domain-containing protein [Anoxynatronum buryatiense]SMP72006.1 Mu transposase, C-terminal [Anoxynatronum buryatiense]